MDRYQQRQWLDRFGAGVAHTVGMLVLLLVVVLMGYLLFAVAPLFWADQPTARSTYSAEPVDSVLLAFAPDESRATRVLVDGQVVRFAPDTGFLFSQVNLQTWLDVSTDSSFMAHQLVDDQQQEYLLVIKPDGEGALLYWNEDALTDQHAWQSRFNLGDQGVTQQVSTWLSNGELTLSAIQQQNEQWLLNSYSVPAADTENSNWSVEHQWLLPEEINSVLMWGAESILLAPSSGGLIQAVFDKDVLEPETSSERLVDYQQSKGLDDAPTSVSIFHALLSLDHNMILAASNKGDIQQLLLQPPNAIQTSPRYQLAANYECSSESIDRLWVSAGVSSWFACIDEQSRANIFYIGRHSPAWQSSANIATSSMALTAERLLLDDGDSLYYLQRIDQPPLNAELLWQTVWYPGYSAPSHVWQPTAVSAGGPKFGVTPLLFGTIKSAILAILFGIPFAVIGAIYTALILPRYWRERIKPIVEMLEAMPTVIIGFLAAVWLAPFLQNHLFVFSLMVFGLPFALILLGYGWSKFLTQRVSSRLRRWLPGILIAATILLLLGVGWLLEYWLFAGQLSAWLEQQWNWTYDLRNALVVGIALGLAITPTIFALCEDALTAVPQYLRQGALALGASRWQAIWQVIVPCAASGLMAAILIGLGRALGETMIVLMAASNTPLIETSPLRGLQAIAPTLAIEMPEADPGSLHFRVLLLCALVLFLFTLLANTLAEIIRERLRRRYQL